MCREWTFKKAVVEAGVRMIKFHNLRSTYASQYCMHGGQIHTLSKILGHSTVDMTSKKYAHLSPDYLKEAAQVVNFEVTSSHNSSRLEINRAQLQLIS